MEIVGDEIIVSVLGDGRHERGELAGVAEGAGCDGVEDFGEVRVEVEAAVEVAVAELFDVFGEVAEEEDVLFADFAGDFNLFTEY